MPQSPYLGGLIYGYRYIQSNGTLESQHDTLNFTGGGVTVTDDSPNGRTNVNITAGSSAINGLVGDVLATGPGTPSATVVGLQTFPISTTPPSLSTSVLAWNGVWFEPAPIGSGSGLNQLTGDGTAGPGSGSQVLTVVKVHGASVPIAGALTTGNAAYVSGSSALTYSALNLGGGSGWITGLLPVASFTPGTAGQIFVSDATPNAAWTSLIKYETTHGRFTSGGGGSDYMAVIGPTPSHETAAASLHLLANGVSPTANNLTAYSDGSTYTGISGATHLLLANTGGYNATWNVDLSSAGFHIGADGLISPQFIFGFSDGTFQMLNQSTPSTPTGGPKLFGSSGAAKVIGTSGTITTFGPAEPHCPVCGSDFTTEHESPVYGYLAICLVCLADELGDRPWIRRTKG